MIHLENGPFAEINGLDSKMPIAHSNKISFFNDKNL